MAWVIYLLERLVAFLNTVDLDTVSLFRQEPPEPLFSETSAVLKTTSFFLYGPPSSVFVVWTFARFAGDHVHPCPLRFHSRSAYPENIKSSHILPLPSPIRYLIMEKRFDASWTSAWYMS